VPGTDFKFSTIRAWSLATLGHHCLVSEPITSEMRAWIDDQVHACGHGKVTAVEVFRVKPWATVASVKTRGERLWFKANQASFAYEGALLVLLESAVPGRVIAPIALNDDTGWFLTLDGGAIASDATVEAASVIERYVEVQLGSRQLVDQMIAIGVPDRRPARLPDLFDRAVVHAAAGDASPRCIPMRSRLVELCSILDEDDRVCVVNGDLKTDHAFVGPPVRIFDWADSVIAHPLTGLSGVARNFDGDEQTRRELEEKLIAPWGEPDDRRVVDAAGVVAHLLNVDVWLRDLPELLESHPDRINHWLHAFANAMEQFDWNTS